jgi:CubicO group peptidase (beta-lactamase class C family)
MQLALTDLTGKSFPELMRELVLGPVGMSSSGYEQPLPEAKRARAAIAHRGNGNVVEGLWHTYPEMAAAGLWTTPTDLLLFARAIQRSLGGEPNSLLSQKMAREFVTVQKGRYGLGVAVEGSGEKAQFSHGGANEGYRRTFFAFTEHGDGVAIMTNSDNGGQIANEIARAVSDVYGWGVMQAVAKQVVDVDQSQLKAIAGRYVVATPSDTIPLTMRYQDGVLFAEVPFLSPTPVRLYAAEPNRFLMLETGVEFGIDRDATGAVVAIRLLNVGQPLRALRER